MKNILNIRACRFFCVALVLSIFIPFSASALDTLIHDSFETGLGNWTTSSVIINNKAQNIYSGAQAAEFTDAVIPGAWIMDSLNLSEYQGTDSLSLSFAWMDYSRWETTDSFLVEIDFNNNGSWKKLYAHAGDQDVYTEVFVNLATASYLSDRYLLRFRFVWDGSAAQEGAFLDSVRLIGNKAVAPTLTGLDAAVSLGAVQKTDGSDSVSIMFEASDKESDSVAITAEYRIGVGGWSVLPPEFLQGDYGRIAGNSSTTDRRIAWDVLGHLGAVEATNYQVRLTADDESGGMYDSSVTALAFANLLIDTKAPRTLGSFVAIDSTKDSITVVWSTATDANFDHYEIWYGTVLSDVVSRNGGAIEWDATDDVNLGSVATGTTHVTGLNPGTNYFVKIWAIDAYGNDTTTMFDSMQTAPTPAPVVTGWDPYLPVYAAQVDSDSVMIGYEVSDLDDAVVTVTAQYQILNGPWMALTTNIVGDTGQINTSTITNDTILWDIKTAFGADVDTQVVVRIIASDGTSADTTLTEQFIIDIRQPVWSGAFTAVGSTASTITLGWSAVTESNFDHYKVWYGTVRSNVLNRSGAGEWNGANDPNMNIRTTSGTVISGLSFNTKYYFKIWAHDSLGHQSTVADDSMMTQSGDLPFTDNFEAPGGVGNWTASNVAVDAGAVYNGTQSAFFSPVSPNAYLVRSFDLSPYQGATDVNLFFAWQDKHTFEVEDSFFVDVRRNAGSWQRVYQYGGAMDVFGEVNVDLDAAGNLTENYEVRFTFGWDDNGTQEGIYLDSVRVTGSLPTAPTLTGLAAAAYIGAVQVADGGDSVNITFETADAERDSVFISTEYRIGSGSWTAIPTTYLQGAYGRIDGNNAAADRRIAWNVLAHLGAIEASNYQVRLTADDEYGGAFDSTIVAMQVANLLIDTRAPQGLTGLVKIDSSSSATGRVKLQWTAVSDAHFDHYEIWYGTNITEVSTRSGGAVVWDDTDQLNLATATTDTASITGLTLYATHYFKIWAVDIYGNEDTVATVTYYADDVQVIVNDMTLIVRALSDTSVELSWNPSMIEEAHAGSTGIWYKTGDYPDSAHDITASRIVGYTMTDSVDTLYGLTGGMEYYFSLLCLSTSAGWCDTAVSACDTVIPYGAASVTISAIDLMPTLVAGDTIPIISLAFSSIIGTARLDQIPVFRTGTALASDVSQVLLYRDADKNNIPDNPESPLSYAPFISDSTELEFLNTYILSSDENWLIAYVIANDAVITRSAGARLNSNDMDETHWTTATFSGIVTGIYSLPVELSAFTAAYTGSAIEIQWRTESEKNNARWNVKRRQEGEDAYSVVYSVRKNGIEQTTAFATEYHYEDVSIEPGRGYYYILEDVSLDGEVTAHGPIYVQTVMQQQAPELEVYPTVFSSRVMFNVATHGTGFLHLKIFSTEGKTLITKKLSGEAGIVWNGIGRNGQEVLPGLYLYEVTSIIGDRTVQYHGSIIKQ